MITFSGQRIDPKSKFDGKYSGVPTIIDIALSLSRTPRFAGMTRRYWPVLLHSIVCAEIAQLMSKGTDRKRIMLCLLHDAHEAITGDIAAFWKPAQMKEWQHEIDEAFFTSLNLWPISEDDLAFIKKVDSEALRAEALAVGPPTIMQHMALPANSSYQIVLQTMGRFPDAQSCEGLGSKGVQEFLDRFADLYRDVAANICDDTPFNQPPSAN